MSNRLAITLLIYGMVQAVIFGAGLLTLLWSPLKADTGTLIAIIAAFSLVLAAPAAWMLSPMMRSKHQRRLARDGKLGEPFPG